MNDKDRQIEKSWEPLDPGSRSYSPTGKEPIDKNPVEIGSGTSVEKPPKDKKRSKDLGEVDRET